MEKSRSSIQTPKLSNRHEAAIIEQIIHKRLYADVKSEGMECDIPSGSSCRDDGYSNLWNHDGARIKLFRGVFAPVNGPLCCIVVAPSRFTIMALHPLGPKL
ncbi:hypothetical protein GCK32_013952, partial [Trichostrongylus colubriformis]